VNQSLHLARRFKTSLQLPSVQTGGRSMKCRIATPAILILAMTAGSALAGETRTLTIEDRLKAQEAIERVRYSHQLGAVRTFDEAFPRAALLGKVRVSLKEEVALQRFWNTRVTAEALDRELDRMVRHTRMPERLQELFRALGDDPFLIRECLARPVLADRLVRAFFANDRSLHEDARAAAETLRARLLRGDLDAEKDSPGRTVMEFLRQSLSAEDFDTLASEIQGPVGTVGPVTDEEDAFVVRIVLARSPDALRVARFAIAKGSWDAWWSRVGDSLDETTVSPVAGAGPLSQASTTSTTCANDDQWVNGSLDDVPDPRYGASAVWTGSQMLVWGGLGPSASDRSGGRYDPATDIWQPISRIGAPSARERASAVWTGSAMIVWGGQESTFVPLNTGGRYDPLSDTWTPTSAPAPNSGRADHTAVWTGTQMIVWGGTSRDRSSGHISYFGGMKYDPALDSWSSVSSFPAPEPRARHVAVWTGNTMLVWGGEGSSGSLNSGARYDPTTDSWTPMTLASAPGPRVGATGVWTGSVLTVWGGIFTNTGGNYDPTTDAWQATSIVNAPTGVSGHSAVWTGSRMLIWGGSNGTQDVATGALYNPTTNSWSAVSTTNAPTARDRHSALWTGSMVVVWGGTGNDGMSVNTGARYNPTTNSWTPTSVGTAPRPRSGATAVWTGTQMIIWGGYNGAGYLGTGGRYDPVTDSWLPTTLVFAPSARSGHTAVWTGQEMVIFGGGFANAPLSTAERYSPATDTWVGIPPSTIAGRYGHTAVWTGTSMLVWGGFVQGPTDPVMTNTGGRYDPVSNNWTPLSTTNAPSPRAVAHGAVWTGTRMLIWGGGIGENTGGLYDPSTDTWTPTTTTNAPILDQAPSLVWAGTQALVWGRTTASPPQPAGGRYNPTTDAWSSLSSFNAPAPNRPAVWTGNRMLVWNGDTPGTSARYDPASDSWSPMSFQGSPTPRSNHASVWTGAEMLVFGGTSDSSTHYLNSGGGYCSCQPVTYYTDSDGDGFGDPNLPVISCVQPAAAVPDGSDCDDSMAQAWHGPSEAQNLRMPDERTLAWDPPAAAGATALLYDLIRSTQPGDFVSSAACIATGSPSLSSTDDDRPTLGTIYFYLVRARNSCPNGLGPLGSASDGTPRTGRTCP
jgi:N-acetylneuraminic acid mutarotase